jgi:hypothetical protein
MPAKLSVPMTTRTPRLDRVAEVALLALEEVAHLLDRPGRRPRRARCAPSSISEKLMLNVGIRGTSRSSMRSIPSSSIRSPCSMLVMPARRAFLMPPVPSAWASVPRIPAARASSTMARISSTVNCDASGLSAADQTPPVAMTLIQSAPARIWSLAARRTASGPSATPGGRSLISVAMTAPDGVQSSPWPPVCESGWQLTCVLGTREGARGEGPLDPRRGVARVTDGRDTASRNSRPAWRQRTTMSVAERWTWSWTGSRRSARWTWQSMMPGRPSAQ